MVGTRNPLPWLSRADFKSPHCLQSNRKKSVEPSLCPRCCQKQQVARILRFFTLANPCWISPVSPSARPALLLLFSTSADQIRRSLWKVSAVSQSFDIYTGQHPAIIQSRCHLSVSLWIKISFIFCIEGLTLGLTQCQFSRLCSPHWASVESRYSVASCAYFTHVACKYLITHYTVHQVLFMVLCKLDRSLYRFIFSIIHSVTLVLFTPLLHIISARRWSRFVPERVCDRVRGCVCVLRTQRVERACVYCMPACVYCMYARIRVSEREVHVWLILWLLD